MDRFLYEEAENGLIKEVPVQMDRAACLRLFVVGACLALGLLGCTQSAPRTDAEYQQDPNYQRAKKLYEAGDYQGAAASYEKTLLDAGMHTSWATVREQLKTHQVNTIVLPTDGGMELRIRKATTPEPVH